MLGFRALSGAVCSNSCITADVPPEQLLSLFLQTLDSGSRVSQCHKGAAARGGPHGFGCCQAFRRFLGSPCHSCSCCVGKQELSLWWVRLEVQDLLICLSVHMPGAGFADLLPDSWGIAQIFPQLWGLALVQLQVPFHKRNIQQSSLFFAEKLQVMPIVTFSLRLVCCGSSCRDGIAEWIYPFPLTAGGP